MKSIAIVSLVLIGASATCAAYEVDTHASITKSAFDRSVLSPSSPAYAETYKMLGWDRMLEAQPFNLPVGVSLTGADENSYYDLSGSWLPSAPLPFDYARPVNYFEQRRMPSPYRSADPVLGNRPWLRFEAWLMRGAIREDDLARSEYIDGVAPDIDPHGELTRVLRHFYNPVDDTAIPTFARSTDWALGTINALDIPPVYTTARDNHFTWADARRAYYQALTFKAFNPSTADPAKAHADFSRRYFFWGTAIKSIGHVLHLLQDAAQPQHTRVDYHNHSNGWLAGNFNTDLQRRTYELFTNVRALGGASSAELPYVPERDEERLVDLLGQPLNRGVADPLVVGNYPVPSFTLPTEFFTTKVSDPVQLSRRGIADYSNRSFLTEGTLFNSASYPLPPSGIASPGNEVVSVVIATTIGNVRVKEVRRAVPDSAAPAHVDSVLVPFGGKAPLYSVSLWDQFGEGSGDGPGRIITLQQYRIHADVLIPRAVAYSAGLIDYFMRGRLEVSPTIQNAFAVLNQGEPHTVDAAGYPRRPNNSIFGFEKVRLRVRNVTSAITESGGVGTVVQGTPNGTLVAVARYHRNACYKPDMTGDRVIGYAPPPSIGTISEPTCSGSTPQRTGYQEISVSAPLTIASAADLPGGEGAGGPATPVEKTFDFSADPIPVNATDLFIQVVYRGQLGEEPDAVAVGTYDVREPTFIGIYNNTDYYWNSIISQWVSHSQTALYPWQNVDYLRVCTGASTNSRWAYYAEPIAGMPPLGIPSPTPGAVRLSILFAAPNPPTQQFSVRVTPVMAGSASASERSSFTRGAIRQGNKELISPTALGSPQYCTFAAPTGTDYWCNDPIHRRRGMLLGHVVAPIYYDSGFGNTGVDVDSVPLPTFTGLRQHNAGTIKYNDASLSNCPQPPSSATASMSRSLVELMEMAADMGIEVE